MTEPIRVLHFINQFFGGIGGEEHANIGVEVCEEAVGPAESCRLPSETQGPLSPRWSAETTTWSITRTMR